MIITNYLSEVLPKSLRKYFSENFIIMIIFKINFVFYLLNIKLKIYSKLDWSFLDIILKIFNFNLKEIGKKLRQNIKK